MNTNNNVLIYTIVLTGAILLSISTLSCQETKPEKQAESTTTETTPEAEEYAPSFDLSPPPISEFVRRIFEDSNGNLWLGTNGDGVFKYDCTNLTSNTFENGFGGYAVRAIKEDRTGNVWFGTSDGVSKYDGAEFTNYTIGETQASNQVWSLLIDSKDVIWVGTIDGVSTFDGKTFTPFTLLPETESDPLRGVSSTTVIHDIMEDKTGRLWFATNGGAFIYDGTSLTNISEKDGLCNNAVNDILEDTKGNIWFATHHNGVCMWDGSSFTHFDETYNVTGIEAWSLFEDSNGHIWFPIENSGLYRYDGKTFTNYSTADGLTTNAVQSIHQDAKGRIWVGGYKGLFRFDEEQFYPVSQMGPWN